MAFSRLPILFVATFCLLTLGARGGCNIFGCDGPEERDYTLTVPYTAEALSGGFPASDPCEGAHDCRGKCPKPVDPNSDELMDCSCEATDGGTGATLTCNYHTWPAECETGG